MAVVTFIQGVERMDLVASCKVNSYIFWVSVLLVFACVLGFDTIEALYSFSIGS